MIQADVDTQGQRWFLWVYPPIIAVLLFITGVETVRGKPEIPFIVFMTLGLFSFLTLPLGTHNFALPRSRSQWFWSRIRILATILLTALGFWALGLAGAIFFSWGTLPNLGPSLWAFGLFSAMALGPFVAALMLKPRGRETRLIPFLATAMYFVLSFTPWGILGTWADQLSPVLALALGITLFAAVPVFWLTTLLTLPRRDWGGNS